MRRSRRETSSLYESSDDQRQSPVPRDVPGVNPPRSEVVHSKAPSLEDNEAALAIEDIAMNRTSNQRLDDLRGPIRELNDKSRIIVSDLGFLSPLESGQNASGIMGNSTHEDDRRNIVVPGLEALPSQELADYLLQHFVSGMVSLAGTRRSSVSGFGMIASRVSSPRI